MGAELPRPDRLPRIPRAGWALGFVSMFMDLSSEIIHALLPLFLTVTLGVSVAMVGLIDGIAEATASISKVFSGLYLGPNGPAKAIDPFGVWTGRFEQAPFCPSRLSAGGTRRAVCGQDW